MLLNYKYTMSNILHSWHKGRYFNRKTSSPKNVNVQIVRKTLHLNLHSFASYSTSSVWTLTGKHTQQGRMRVTGPAPQLGSVSGGLGRPTPRTILHSTRDSSMLHPWWEQEEKPESATFSSSIWYKGPAHYCNLLMANLKCFWIRFVTWCKE